MTISINRRIVDLVHDKHCTTSALSSIVFEADRRCDLRGLLGMSETLWHKRGSFETTVLIAPPNLVEGLLLGTDKRVCGVFHPVWCFLWCFSPEVKSPQILVVICVAISPQVQITTSICGDLFEFQSKVGGHDENIKNMFDSMCTLYLECFLQGIEEHFQAKKCKPKISPSPNHHKSQLGANLDCMTDVFLLSLPKTLTLHISTFYSCEYGAFSLLLGCMSPIWVTSPIWDWAG